MTLPQRGSCTPNGVYDGETHAAGVSKLARGIAKALSLKPEAVEQITLAAYLHDLGKQYISSDILNRPGALTDDEYATMKEHTRIGFKMLRSIELMEIAALAALEHHEKYDGRGYMGYAGESISLVGRIVAVADVYDALRTDRPYRPAWKHKRILRHMIDERGRSFDPIIVDSLLKCLEHNRKSSLFLEAAGFRV